MNGLMMMLRAFGIEIDPAELEAQIRTSAQQAFDLLTSINNRLGNIETQNANMQKSLDRIERNGIPMFASEGLLEDFYRKNPGIQSEADFLLLTGAQSNGEEINGKPN